MEIERLGSNRGFVLLLPNASSAIGGYFCVPELNEGFGVLFVWFVWVLFPPVDRNREGEAGKKYYTEKVFF